MSIRKNIRAVCLVVAICLPAGLISPVQSQNSPPKKAPLPKAAAPVIEPCPTGNLLLPVIDVCQAIGKQINPQLAPNITKQIELRKLDHNSIWLPPHDDYTLRATQDQVAWTCKSHSFQILKIEGILNPDSKQVPPPSPPPFPFCPKLKDHINDLPGKAVLAPGTILYSGTPVMEAEGDCFKWTAVYGDWDAATRKFSHLVTVDPHLIVTGPDSTGYRVAPGNSPPSKKCVYSERVVPRNHPD